MTSDAPVVPDNATHQAFTLSSEYVAFTLGNEEYGIDIQQVQELRSYEEPTRIANAPPFLKGVVNLRGLIVPIVDMRIKFNLGEPKYDHFTVVVILRVTGKTIGLVVDSVSDVITLNPQDIKSAPELGGALAANYVLGLGSINERLVILVDINRLLSGSEAGLITEYAA